MPVVKPISSVLLISFHLIFRLIFIVLSPFQLGIASGIWISQFGEREGRKKARKKERKKERDARIILDPSQPYSGPCINLYGIGHFVWINSGRKPFFGCMFLSISFTCEYIFISTSCTSLAQSLKAYSSKRLSKVTEVAKKHHIVKLDVKNPTRKLSPVLI